MATEVLTTKLRALVGEWGEEFLFLGAVEGSTYEAICDDDANEGTDRWGQRIQQWKDEGPCGISETREVWVRLQFDPALFTAPMLAAFAEEATDAN